MSSDSVSSSSRAVSRLLLVMRGESGGEVESVCEEDGEDVLDAVEDVDVGERRAEE